jgi:hypothetical protein
MKKTLLLAGIIVFAGAAHGQGIINGAGSMNGAGGLNGHSSIDSEVVTAVNRPSEPPPVSDVVVNQNSKNPGDFVPSTFSNYREAVALGEFEAHQKPLTIVEAARLAQQQKKNASPKPVLQVQQNAQGKLVIAAAQP